MEAMEKIQKYPRTQHIEGSRLQAGDEDLSSVPFDEIAGRHLVVEEKVDGANCAVSFSSSGKLLLQSRGHYLIGGGREKHFNLFKQWANVHAERLWDALRDRYVMYGEWLYAKHTVFYNELPHYFMEFDVLDMTDMTFLDTPSRQILLEGLPVSSVPVLHSGRIKTLENLTALVAPSLYINSSFREDLAALCTERHLDVDRAMRETDLSGLMEGLYIKVEDEETGRLIARYKYVRASFLQAVFEAEGHWLSRPIIPNQLRSGVDIFAS